jgi:hypothetical protein
MPATRTTPPAPQTPGLPLRPYQEAALQAFSVNRRNFWRQNIYPLSHNDL